MPIQTIVGPTILAGQFLSAPLNVSNGVVFRIITPSLWTPAKLTFQLSINGAQFFNVHDEGGAELVRMCVPNTAVLVQTYLQHVHSIKFRSGTARRPVVQSAQRVFTLLINTVQP